MAITLGQAVANQSVLGVTSLAVGSTQKLNAPRTGQLLICTGRSSSTTPTAFSIADNTTSGGTWNVLIARMVNGTTDLLVSWYKVANANDAANGSYQVTVSWTGTSGTTNGGIIIEVDEWDGFVGVPTPDPNNIVSALASSGTSGTADVLGTGSSAASAELVLTFIAWNNSTSNPSFTAENQLPVAPVINSATNGGTLYTAYLCLGGAQQTGNFLDLAYILVQWTTSRNFITISKGFYDPNVVAPSSPRRRPISLASQRHPVLTHARTDAAPPVVPPRRRPSVLQASRRRPVGHVPAGTVSVSPARRRPPQMAPGRRRRADVPPTTAATSIPVQASPRRRSGLPLLRRRRFPGAVPRDTHIVAPQRARRAYLASSRRRAARGAPPQVVTSIPVAASPPRRRSLLWLVRRALGRFVPGGASPPPVTPVSPMYPQQSIELWSFGEAIDHWDFDGTREEWGFGRSVVKGVN